MLLQASDAPDFQSLVVVVLILGGAALDGIPIAWAE
jgi:hypothetical protein